MGNMGYCRFENTLDDLKDCQEHLWDDLSESEQQCRRELIELCIQIADECEEEL